MKATDLFFALAIVATWGINFSVIKLGVSEMDPFILTGLRFTLVVFPLIFFIRKPEVAWSRLASYGIFFGVGVWGMLTMSIYAGLSAGMASLLLQMSAFISMLLGVALLREKISLFTLSGLVIALAGVCFILSINDGSLSLSGVILAFIAAFCFSYVGLIVKKTKIDNMFAFIIWSCLFAPLPLFILSWCINGPQGYLTLMQDITAQAVFSVLFQAYPVTLVGYWGWNSLLKRYPMATMAPLTLLIPLFGLLTSAIFYQEALTPTKSIACVLVLVGLSFGLFESKIKAIASKDTLIRP